MFNQLLRLAIVPLAILTLCSSIRAEAPQLKAFVQKHCVDCHSGDEPEAGLDLERLLPRSTDPVALPTWVKVHDRIQAGEMPPDYVDQPTEQEKKIVVDSLSKSLTAINSEQQSKHGRVQLRRLNRTEYEYTLRDLLALPNLEVAGMLPPDNTAHGFDKVGSALELSYVQLARYLEAADAALDQAMVLTPRPAPHKVRLMAKSNGRLAQVLNKKKEAVPVGEAVGLLRQPNTAQAPWWWSKFQPSADGVYRIRMKSFGFVWDKGEVRPADRTHAVTFLAVQQTSKRPLGTFDIGRSQQQATIHDFKAFLRQGDLLEFRLETLDDRNRGKRALENYTAPGVAVEWLEVEGPLVEAWPSQSYRHLFGDLPLEEWTHDSGVKEPPIPMIVDGVGKRAKLVRAKRNKITLYHVVSPQPRQDAKRLLLEFANRAFRRPVQPEELEDIAKLVYLKLDEKLCFQEAMRIGYQAILCSPEFLYFREQPSRLDPFALASRLSYFLWDSMPDDTLMALAKRGELSRDAVLREQVERMLADPKSQRFVESFCGQWLDLREITTTEPDEQLYPEFDQLLLDSMVRETLAYFTEMLRLDLGVAHLVASDFAMVNGRLAKLYDIPDVDGVEIRKVKLPPGSPRGGFLTQASVLKVTANGTTTSPVLRGAWVLDRIYGQPARLPPPNIPAVEPDLRGTTTIRQQLDKHRDVASCATCHKHIDPPGFALENFDVIGGWRERYRALEKGDPVKKTFKGGRPVRYKFGLPVDASGVTQGQKFSDIHDFRKILLDRREQLARNLVQKLLVYATGAGIEFADRAVVEQILEQTREQGYGLRTLVHAVVQSETFQRK